MEYSEYRLERIGKRTQDEFILTYAPKDSLCGVQQRLPYWIAQLVRSVLIEKCPENVIELPYGSNQEIYNKPTTEGSKP